MYYDVYIDVVFVVNTVTNFFILKLLCIGLRSRSKNLRLLLTAGLGAVLGMLQFFLIVPAQWFNIVTEVLLSFFMSVCGFGWHGKKTVVAGTGIYGMSFLLAGGLSWLAQMGVQFNVPVFLGSVCILYAAAGKSILFFQKQKKKEERICPVVVKTEVGMKQCLGLLDSGNSLKEPITGKPVHVVYMGEFLGILSESQKDWLLGFYQGKNTDTENVEHIFMVPYRSVGKKQGILPVFCIPYLCMQKEEEPIVVKDAFLAFSSEEVSNKNQYQIILNAEYVS